MSPFCWLKMVQIYLEWVNREITCLQEIEQFHSTQLNFWLSAGLACLLTFFSGYVSLSMFSDARFKGEQAVKYGGGKTKKIFDLPSGKINDPSSRIHFYFSFLPATPLSPSRALLPELQRYKDTIRCAALGAEVPGHRQQQLTQTLIVRLMKTHFLPPILDCEKTTE